MRLFIPNCSRLEYVSSLGLGTLVRANSRLQRQDGRIALVGVNGVVADIIRIVRLDRLLDMHPTVDDAAEALQKP